MEINTTRHYNKFKLINFNREINEKHVKKLVKSMQVQYLPIPILVNKNMEIIDGQHRFTACQQLGLPIYYAIMLEEKSVDLIQRINSLSKAWKLTDYHRAYVIQGQQEYIKLNNLLKKYDISLDFYLAVHGNDLGRNTRISFKEGKYKVTVANKQNLALTMQFYNRIKGDFPKVTKHSKFMRAFSNIIVAQLKTQKQRDYFIMTVKQNGDAPEYLGTKKENSTVYLWTLISLYNTGLPESQRLELPFLEQ
jgi:hypothetical protein